MGATCWNVFANEMAVTDGATAPPRPDTDPDDVSWIEPPICPRCSFCAHLPDRVRPVGQPRYGGDARQRRPRALPLAPDEAAGPIRVTTDIAAVRVRGIDPLPGDLVVPAHSMMCVPQGGEP